MSDYRSMTDDEVISEFADYLKRNELITDYIDDALAGYVPDRDRMIELMIEN